jgi:DNA-directed DNA polymerase III PolC
MLHVRSHYSLLTGATPLERLVARARELELPALALTDDDNLYGAAFFLDAAARAGLRAVVGAQVDDGATRALLLPRTSRGFAHLCRVLSRRHLDPAFLLVDALRDAHEGLFLLTEDAALARAAREFWEPGALALELVRPGRTAPHEVALARAARELDLPLVASGDVHFATAEEQPLHRALVAIREGKTLADELPLAHPGQHLRSVAGLERLFADRPDAVRNALAVLEECVPPTVPDRPVFPRFPLPEGVEAAARLRALCREGVPRRYDRPPPGLAARLERELDLIVRLGYADYFLVVHDIVAHSRARGVPVAGRGSGASSLVAYLLRITNVDPLRYRLQFERFLNEGRVDCPDLDVDFCWRIRDDILAYVFAKWGEDHAAMVSTHITLQPRSAFRESAKVHGLSEEEITRLKERLPATIDERLDAPLPKNLPIDEERLRAILATARALLGFPRHLSVHPGGVVITPDPIDLHAPLQRAAKGVVVTHFEKDSVEKMGLVKLDLLGNRALSTIRETLDLVERRHGARPDVERIAPDDPATVRLLRRGDTIGVNQLESPAMRHLLLMLQPADAERVMQALALIRPGAAAIGMKEAFVRRARGLEPPRCAHPRLEPVLGDTYGVMLYEDDALLVAAAMGGMPLAEADRFRRAIAKARTDDERLALSDRFLDACRRNGVPPAAAAEQWLHMAKFNSYSFCKAHAASYGVLAWAAAWLKAHRPLEFWVAALNNNQGMYDPSVYVEEAKRAGIGVRLPCVNASGDEFTVEPGAIRIGLGRVRELSERARAALFRERERGRFASLQDLIARVPALEQGEVQNLVRCGALDGTGRPRPELLLELRLVWNAARRARGTRSLAPDALASPRLPALRAPTEEERLRDELELLGLNVHAHLMTFFRPGLRVPGLQDSRQVPSHVGRSIRLAGMLDALRITETDRGDSMEFLTLEDEHGVFEVTMFPDAFRRFSAEVRTWGPYLVEGKVEDQHGSLTITLGRIAPIGGQAPFRPPKRGLTSFLDGCGGRR